MFINNNDIRYDIFNEDYIPIELRGCGKNINLIDLNGILENKPMIIYRKYDYEKCNERFMMINKCSDLKLSEIKLLQYAAIYEIRNRNSLEIKYYLATFNRYPIKLNYRDEISMVHNVLYNYYDRYVPSDYDQDNRRENIKN